VPHGRVHPRKLLSRLDRHLLNAMPFILRNTPRCDTNHSSDNGRANIAATP
jgi:hypothetical protein